MADYPHINARVGLAVNDSEVWNELATIELRYSEVRDLRPEEKQVPEAQRERGVSTMDIVRGLRGLADYIEAQNAKARRGKKDGELVEYPEGPVPHIVLDPRASA